MLAVFLFLVMMAVLAGTLLILLVVLVENITPDHSAKRNQGKNAVEYRLTIEVEKTEGDQNMLPKDLLREISKIIEENTGIKVPRPKTIEEILSSIPAKDRARLLPSLVPIVVDAIQQSTGMNMDASIALEEFLLGQGLGLSELDVAIETDAMKLEKTLGARKRYKEIADHYREEMGEDLVVDFAEKMFTFKLLQEAFKDMQLPPGWSPQQVAGLLGRGTPDNDTAGILWEDGDER